MVITQVLNSAESVGVSYTDALGFFAALDWELIESGEYGPEHIEHALRHAMLDAQRQVSRLSLD